MLIHHSYDQRFVSLIERLRKEYGEKMFELEGIGEEHLDINRFSKQFFRKNTVADATIDSNANVSDMTIFSWENEFKKPILKLNALYILWKSAVEKHGIKRANKLIEHEIKGAVYIHDLHFWKRAYCYASSLTELVNKGMPFYKKIKIGPVKHFDSFINLSLQYICYSSNQIAGACLYPDEFLLIKDKNCVSYNRKIKDIVEMYSLNNKYVNNQGIWEYANIPDGELKVIDNGKFINVKKVFRRKYKGNIYTIKTACGKTIKCSEDHKFKVLFKGRDIEVKAKDLKVFDTLYKGYSNIPVNKNSDEYKDGQFYGIICGDGSITQDDYFRVSINNKEMFIKDFLDEYCIKKFNKKGNFRYDKRGSVGSYVLCSKEIVKKIRNVFNGINCENKSIKNPNQYSIDWWFGFIDGLFVTDGCYNNSHMLSLINKDIINQIKVFLDGFSIKYSYNEISENTKKNKKRLYKLALPSNFKKYFDLVNVKRRNNSKYLKIREKEYSYFGYMAFKHSSLNTKKKYREISGSRKYKDLNLDVITEIKVEKNDYDYVYEIETETNWYSVKGITTHNCALPDFFIYADYFIRKDFGEEWNKDEKIVSKINQLFQNWIYSVNFSWRGSQSPFVNLSVMDKYWLEGLFSEHVNPDFSKPNLENVMRIQKMFVYEMLRNLENNPFTFPVMTACILLDSETKEPKDKEFLEFASEVCAKNGLFNIYTSDSVDSLSSCCRLRNSLETSKEYINSFGSGGINIGSHRVCTINLPQIAYEVDKDFDEFMKILEYRINIAQDILEIHRETIQKIINEGAAPLYTYHFMELSKQFSTIGFIGLYEALELLGTNIREKDGQEKAKKMLNLINEMNEKKTKLTGNIANMEQVPGESASYKLAKKDALLFENAKYKIYSNQYIPLINDADLLERVKIHGVFDKDCSGGSILHLNCQEKITKNQAKKLIKCAGKNGVVYFAINYNFCQCPSCGKVYVGTMDLSPCHNAKVKKFIRVVGFLTEVANFAEPRREEYDHRTFYKNNEIMN